MTELHCPAIDGANPLAFLAAVGTLRLASLHWPEQEITLRWERAGRWIPVLCGLPPIGEPEFCAELLKAPAAPIDLFRTLGKNINVAPGLFSDFAQLALKDTTRADRRPADFAAAFASEVCRHEKRDRVQYSQFCFITGSGHQDFLLTIDKLLRSITADHLQEALFSGWRYKDESNSFRWDPADAREYALRWKEPSKEGAWTTWGANRLAFEALPLYPTHPERARLLTTGFNRLDRKGPPEFTWPIWTSLLTCDEVRSLLAFEGIHDASLSPQALQAMGIGQVYRSAQVRIGQGANFKVSFRPARAVY